MTSGGSSGGLRTNVLPLDCLLSVVTFISENLSEVKRTC